MDDRFSIKKLASHTIFQRLQLFFLLKTECIHKKASSPLLPALRHGALDVVEFHLESTVNSLSDGYRQLFPAIL